MKHSLFIAFILITSLCGAQNATPVYQSNPYLSFGNFLSGVKYAYVTIPKNDLQLMTENPACEVGSALRGVVQYLEEIGFEDVEYGLATNKPEHFPSICELAVVSPTWKFEKNTFSEITLSFQSCNGDVFRFNSDKDIHVNGYADITSTFYKRCLYMYSYKKAQFDANYMLDLPSLTTAWTESKLIDNYLDNGADAIEGIYESALASIDAVKYKLGVVRSGENYQIIYLSGATNYLDWKEGEVKASVTRTAAETLFKTKWKLDNKKEDSNPYITFEKGLMKLVMPGHLDELYIKIMPVGGDNVKTGNTGAVSGTGFAVSEAGLIVTNYHVVKGAQTIKVRGINGDFQKTWLAQVVAEDKNNDLAVIKIIDYNFYSLGEIPYAIGNKSAEVGSEVFVLGYPLRSTMGDEIKLTNGIVSSRSGYQGDITSYQVTAPVQPGSSGGPVFDENGNLIGIVNARHNGAENASYAVKSSYLLNLLDAVPFNTTIKSISLLSGKSLAEKARSLKDFTYIIEVQ